MGRDDPAAVPAYRVGDRFEARGQGGDGVAALSGTAVCAVGVQEIVLHIDENEGGGGGGEVDHIRCSDNW